MSNHKCMVGLERERAIFLYLSRYYRPKHLQILERLASNEKSYSKDTEFFLDYRNVNENIAPGHKMPKLKICPDPTI